MTAYATKAINNLTFDYVHMLIPPRFRCEIAAAPRANRPARDGLSRVTYYTENSALSPSVPTGVHDKHKSNRSILSQRDKDFGL